MKHSISHVYLTKSDEGFEVDIARWMDGKRSQYYSRSYPITPKRAVWFMSYLKDNYEVYDVSITTRHKNLNILFLPKS